MNSVSAFYSQPRSDVTPDTAPLARGLGWFGVVRGLTELVVPRLLARTLGVEPRASTSFLLRAIGLRELVTGLGVLMQPHRPFPLWSRVAGDVLDLALLGLASRSSKLAGARLAGAAAAAAGVMALDVVAARRAQRAHDKANQPVISSVTINKPPAEVYAFFRHLSKLPLFMDYLESVREADSRYSHWVARLPAGRTISWDAKIIEDRPGELIAWRSVEGSLFKARGQVTFAATPDRNVTEVELEMQLEFVGTRPSASVAKFFTEAQIRGDLQRLKQVLEAGGVLHSSTNGHRAPQPPAPPPAGLGQPQLPFISTPPTAAKRARP